MKKYKAIFTSMVISSLAFSFLSIPPIFAATKTQLFKPSKAGRISTVVANTILNGTTPPRNSQGIEGDFYIDTKAMLFYGPKTKTRWPSPTSIRGPQGQTGPSGADAKPGTNVVATGAQGLTGATGPRGEQGPQGIPGVAGPSGAKGESGPPGPSGATGISGSNGPQGPTGPQGPAGPAGAQGPQGPAGGTGAPGGSGAPGANGAVGPAGASGATGPTGPAGATGPSQVLYGALSFPSPIQGAIGSSQSSSSFGTFEPRKSYVVRIQIQTFNVDRLVTAYPLAFDVVAQGATPLISYSYIISNGSSFNASTRRDDVSIAAEVVVDGSQVATSYSLVLTVNCGTNTTSFPVTLTGRYHGKLVGQVTQTS